MVIDMISPELSTELMAMAEKEMAAFVGAVTELFGAEPARHAAEDWIEELEAIDCLDSDVIPDWRQVTIAAAARVANRLSTGRSARGQN